MLQTPLEARNPFSMLGDSATPTPVRRDETDRCATGSLVLLGPSLTPVNEHAGPQLKPEPSILSLPSCHEIDIAKAAGGSSFSADPVFLDRRGAADALRKSANALGVFDRRRRSTFVKFSLRNGCALDGDRRGEAN